MGSSAEEDWFAANSSIPGPSLENFLATDPSELPFLQGATAANEDCVRYKLFADEWGSIGHLQQLRESVLKLVDSVTTGFIWHCEAFTLSVAVPTDGSLEPHLTGEQVFGGNVSDEWFVCYLLFTITSTFKGLTACVTDNDGEFLLIEAAIAIPPFLSPANSNHRVWIRFGQVHLVMPGCMVDRARMPRTLGSGSISLSEGLKAVRESDGSTEADEGVQRLIRRRIKGYPDEAQANIHHVRCFLPLAAAMAFRATPRLVAPAVRAYCSGDPADKKLGVRMARLLESSANVSGMDATGNLQNISRSENPRFVETRVALTRHLYAQLHQAPVASSKAFPPGWGPDDCNLAPAAYSKAAQLGQKLSMGLEAAYQTCAESCSRRARGDLRSAIRPEMWKRFAGGLARNGFFEEELEGSKRYREKTAMAEQFLRDNVLRVDDGGDEDIAVAQRSLRRCSMHEVIDHTLNDTGQDRVFKASLKEDDKEDWLEVSPADLDIMLEEYRRAEADSYTDGNSRGIVDGSHDVHERDSSEARSGDLPSSGRDGTAADEKRNTHESHSGFADAVDGLDDVVTGMNAFVDDSRAGLDGAEVEAVRGHVEFDVDKFMSLLNGEDLLSALEDAAQEDWHGELHDSDDDLLESSEEEDEDLVQSPQRMPDPGVSGSESVLPEGPDIVNSRNQSNPTTVDLFPNPREGRGFPGDAGTGSISHTRTRTGLRPSVASQMQEMEGRPNLDDTAEDTPDEQDEQEQGSGPESNGKSESSFVQEYIAAMEEELDPSSMGQSFEKVGESISEAQIQELQTLGPLDQNGDADPEKWLQNSNPPA
ncbi:unnamed protein product, partial [Hapterophycus canaliculatus]